MLENFGWEFHTEMEGDKIINKVIIKMHKMNATVASSNSSYAIVVCMPPDSLLFLFLRRREPEVALVLLVERATAPSHLVVHGGAQQLPVPGNGGSVRPVVSVVQTQLKDENKRERSWESPMQCD